MNDELSDMLHAAADTAPSELSPSARGEVARLGERTLRRRRIATTGAVVMAAASVTGIVTLSNLGRSSSEKSVLSPAAGSNCDLHATPSQRASDVDYSGDASQSANADGRAAMSQGQAKQTAKDRYMARDVKDSPLIATSVEELTYQEATDKYGFMLQPSVAPSRCVYVVSVGSRPKSLGGNTATGSHFSVLLDELSGASLGVAEPPS